MNLLEFAFPTSPKTTPLLCFTHTILEGQYCSKPPNSWHVRSYVRSLITISSKHVTPEIRLNKGSSSTSSQLCVASSAFGSSTLDLRCGETIPSSRLRKERREQEPPGSWIFVPSSPKHSKTPSDPFLQNTVQNSTIPQTPKHPIRGVCLAGDLPQQRTWVHGHGRPDRRGASADRLRTVRRVGGKQVIQRGSAVFHYIFRFERCVLVSSEGEERTSRRKHKFSPTKDALAPVHGWTVGRIAKVLCVCVCV